MSIGYSCCVWRMARLSAACNMLSMAIPSSFYHDKIHCDLDFIYTKIHEFGSPIMLMSPYLYVCYV